MINVKLLKSPLENGTVPLVLAHVVEDFSTLTFTLVLKIHLVLSENAISVLREYSLKDIPYLMVWGNNAAWVCTVAAQCLHWCSLM